MANIDEFEISCRHNRKLAMFKEDLEQREILARWLDSAMPHMSVIQEMVSLSMRSVIVEP